MVCTSPTRIHAVIDGVEKEMYVPCGKCAACRRQKKREWTIRLIHEAGYWEKKSFVTLTYNSQNLPLDEGLHKRHLQLFFKRLRKRFPREYKIRYFACGEYGDQFGRPHYHAIVYGVSRDHSVLVQECWPFGFVKVEPITMYRIQYVCGYVQKKLDGETSKEVYGDKQPPFQLQSQGLGLRYYQDNSVRLNETLHCKTWDGSSFPLPRYYRRKAGDDIPRERLERESVDAMRESLFSHGIGISDTASPDFVRFVYENQGLGGKYGLGPSPIVESRRIADQTLRKQVERYLKQRGKIK